MNSSPDKMTVLHITAFALRGGCEKNCYHFCAGSPDIHHEIVVLDNRGPMSSEWEGLNVAVTHLDLLRTNLLAFRKGLKGELVRRQYDLVILWSTIRLPLQLSALGDAPQVRVYLGNPLMTNYNSLKDHVLSWFFRINSNVTLMACSSYVAVSHSHDLYFRRFSMKVSLNPVALPSEYPAKHRTPFDFNIGMVARLDPIKDHRTVLMGFKDFQRQVANARLHLVGDGVLRSELMTLAEKENISSFVSFYGDVADVYQHLNRWDVFVYATTMREGLGSVVAEAMANGLACALSDLPMLRELAPADHLVIWFKEGDAEDLTKQLKLLHDDKVLRHKLEQSSFEYAQKHFGVKRFISDYFA